MKNTFKKVTVLGKIFNVSGECHTLNFNEQGVIEMPAEVFKVLMCFLEWYERMERIFYLRTPPHPDLSLKTVTSYDVGIICSDTFDIILEYDNYKSIFQFDNSHLIGEFMYTSDGDLIMSRDLVDPYPVIGPGYHFEQFSDAILSRLDSCEFCSELPLLSFLTDRLPNQRDLMTIIENIVCASEESMRGWITEDDFKDLAGKIIPALFPNDNIVSVSLNSGVEMMRSDGTTVKLPLECMGGGFNQVVFVLQNLWMAMYTDATYVIIGWDAHYHPILRRAFRSWLLSIPVEKFKERLICCSFNEG